MNAHNKEQAELKINGLKTSGFTNLWDGITTGIGLFDGQVDMARVPAIMILTDGRPNEGYLLNSQSLSGEVLLI